MDRKPIYTYNRIALVESLASLIIVGILLIVSNLVAWLTGTDVEYYLLCWLLFFQIRFNCGANNDQKTNRA